jgi:hypothetical protein
MQDTIYLFAAGRCVQKKIETSKWDAGIGLPPDQFGGMLTDLTVGEELTFLNSGGLADAMYRAHSYRLKLLSREGTFQAWLAVRPDLAWAPGPVVRPTGGAATAT